MTTKHLPIGGSTATRTLACPGWINASKDVPKGKSSVYADEGNLLHDAMENFYQNGEEFVDQLARKLSYNGQVLTQELIDDYLIPAYEMVEQVMDQYDIDEFICEPFVEFIPDLAGGSIDMLGVSADGETVVVLDYKFGHAPVSAESAQLKFYALCAHADDKTTSFFDYAEHLVCVIVQPKVSHQPQAVKYPLNITLAEFCIEISEAIELTKKKNPPKESGKHCQYCPAAPYCGTKKQSVKSALAIKPALSETLADALDMVDEVQQWIKDVEKAAHDLLEKGVIVPGYKLVEKRATRKWKNNIEASNALGNYDGTWDRKLKTPAQVEKLFKKHKIDFDLDQLIIKESSGTTVVPETDKRVAVIIPEISDSLKRIVNDGKQQ